MKGFFMIIPTFESFLCSLFQSLVTILRISTNKLADPLLQKMLCPHKYYSREEALSLVCSWHLIICADSIHKQAFGFPIYIMELWKSNDWCKNLKLLQCGSPRTWICCLPSSLTPYRVSVRVQEARGAQGQAALHLPRTPSRTWRGTAWGCADPGTENRNGVDAQALSKLYQQSYTSYQQKVELL